MATLFTQLFVMSRILNECEDADKLQKNIVTQMTENHRNKAANMMSRLKSLGIKTYMEEEIIKCKRISSPENLENEIQIVSALLNLLMRHYPKQYDDVVKPKPNLNNSDGDSDNDKYYCQLFKHNDLVPYIFGYLELLELNDCSLVNAIWLLNAFNCNSIYNVDLHDEILWNKKIVNFHMYHVWQRVINCKSIFISKFLQDDPDDDEDDNDNNNDDDSENKNNNDELNFFGTNMSFLKLFIHSF